MNLFDFIVLNQLFVACMVYMYHNKIKPDMDKGDASKTAMYINRVYDATDGVITSFVAMTSAVIFIPYWAITGQLSASHYNKPASKWTAIPLMLIYAGICSFMYIQTLLFVTIIITLFPKSNIDFSLINRPDK